MDRLAFEATFELPGLRGERLSLRFSRSLGYSPIELDNNFLLNCLALIVSPEWFPFANPEILNIFRPLELDLNFGC